MKKRIFSLFCAVLMLTAVCVPAFAVENNQASVASANATLPGIDHLDFYGSSGTRYYVYFSSDVIGYNHVTNGKPVKVCQAYSKATGGNPGTIDGIWGNNSDTALRTAQGRLRTVYSQITVDGVCGTNTWKAFAGYHSDGFNTNYDPPVAVIAVL